jgi:glycosyltransferase involved in cell wall biosynthesis
MKILFFIDSMTSGGKERRLTELLKALHTVKNIEYELVVMCNDIHYDEIFDLKIRMHNIIRMHKKDILVFRKFYMLCKEYKPDIVHCWDSMTAIYAIPSCKLLNIKLVNGLVVDYPLNQSVFNKYILRARITFLFSDIIIGNSDAGLKAYKAPKRKSNVIKNGFNFDRTNGIELKNHVRDEFNIRSTYIIGMVASFSKFKDYATFYKSACLILSKRKDVTFLAVGNNTDLDSSISLVDEKFRDYFHFLGKRSDVEILINSMDICVLSTFTEGISNSILEYMALGKPVIATAGGGTNEILRDNITGFLVSPSNPDEIAEKVDMLLNDESLRTAMGQAGKELIKTQFSIAAMVNKYISCYDTLYSG